MERNGVSLNIEVKSAQPVTTF